MVKVFKAGERAFVDSIEGLLKCKVLEVIEPGSGRKCTQGKVRVRLTDSRRRGTECTTVASRVVPRSMVRCRSGFFKINVNFAWE